MSTFSANVVICVARQLRQEGRNFESSFDEETVDVLAKRWTFLPRGALVAALLELGYRPAYELGEAFPDEESSPALSKFTL
jgi:hypothetical protein